MTQPGYPPYGGGGGGYGPPGGGGYGPPPGGGGYGPPPGGGGGGYGAPPGGGGYGAPPGGAYGVPPAPPGKKKSGLGLILGIVGGLFVLAIVGGAAAFMMLKPKRGLPVDAKDLPTTTKEMSTHLIEATREPNEDVKRIYLASELGGQLCHPGFGDIAHRMEGLGKASPREAKEFFFDKKKVEAVQQVLECGGLLGGVLDSPYESAFAFDDDGKMRRVLIVKMHATEIPSKFGFSKQTFASIPGFCRTQDDDTLGKSDEAPKTVECKDTSHAAFVDPQRPVWYIGDKAALDKVAKTVANPREELTASVTALKDAASQTSGLPDVQLAGTPKTSKDFLMAPCEWAQYKSGQFFDKDFRESCFPAKALESNIQQVDSKIRGAAFEIDDDFVKAAAIKGNIILVARDDDGAKGLEKDLQEIVTDWKAHVDQHSPKLVKEIKDDAHTRKQKEFAAIVDTFFVALQKMKVTRAGRVVRISYNEKLSSGDVAGLVDAEQSTRERRVAVAGILTAIQQKKPVPQASLAKLVGASWAAYLTGPPPPEPKAGMKTKLTSTECHEAQNHLKNVKSTDLTNDDGRMLYIRVKYSMCSASNLPEVSTQEKACLLAEFKTPEDLNKCLSFSTGSPNEPPSSEFGDNAKKK